MTVLTILNHGTTNSTADRSLVITRILDSLDPLSAFRMNEGAGTLKLFRAGVLTDFTRGTLRGRGVEGNVTASINWVAQTLPNIGAGDVVNLAGHSRGSITCYKIAHELNNRWPLVQVNIFAIDPVPGNTGNRITRNGANYENIVLENNVRNGNSFLMLAESEHRIVFRPYIDALYCNGFPNHDFDTLPGTHGGINGLGKSEKEAASLVLSRALAFLQANGSQLTAAGQLLILDEADRRDLYVDLMNNLEKYKADATFRPFRSFRAFGSAPGNIFTSGRSDHHRVVNVHGSAAQFVASNQPSNDPQGHGNFKGLALTDALDLMRAGKVPGQAYAPASQRFFCNLEHENLFHIRYPNLTPRIMALERSGVGGAPRVGVFKSFKSPDEYPHMSPKEQTYLLSFLEKMGIKERWIQFERKKEKLGA